MSTTRMTEASQGSCGKLGGGTRFTRRRFFSAPSRAFNEGCRGCGGVESRHADERSWWSPEKSQRPHWVLDMGKRSAPRHIKALSASEDSRSSDRPTPFNSTNTTVAPCIRCRADGRGVDRPRISIATPFL